ncbi:hypothetical protein SEA_PHRAPPUCCINO_159 [Mycobacterium phage Phrappuccino]|uniref:Uncharacterized protein n=1 Tax=Mycobacterium phage Phrappuccino TaxID=2591223 RepID=A0A514DDZ3_9CAUD|nr:hypothetical protein KHQ87_gp159 [Mycobacterium phage Phrappuccino]QDH91834.1 hypothetical protein SEA_PHRAPPUCCINO_159 [Mycobacterium phage Phrappuccino]QIQ63276.1 hypothetical protein SEA_SETTECANDELA_159 [Mycobacterium phage Settecandela]
MASTPITFRTTELAKVVQRAIDSHAEALRDYNRQADQHRRAHRRQWLADHAAQVKAHRDYLTRCLRNGTAPTSAGVRTATGMSAADLVYDEVGDYVIRRLFGNPPVLPTAEYQGLVELLKAHTGETISANQLHALGFRTSRLQQLFRDAATGAAA